MSSTGKVNARGTTARKKGPRIPTMTYSITLLVVIAAAFWLGNPNFLTPYNVNTILSYAVLLLMVGLGQMCAILVGGIELSVQFFFNNQIDARGRPFSCPWNERLVGIDAEALLRIPRRVEVAAGPDKAEAVRAALLGGLIGTLMADEGLARALL